MEKKSNSEFRNYLEDSLKLNRDVLAIVEKGFNYQKEVFECANRVTEFLDNYLGRIKNEEKVIMYVKHMCDYLTEFNERHNDLMKNLDVIIKTDGENAKLVLERDL